MLIESQTAPAYAILFGTAIVCISGSLITWWRNRRRREPVVIGGELRLLRRSEIRRRLGRLQGRAK